METCLVKKQARLISNDISGCNRSADNHGKYFVEEVARVALRLLECC